MGYCLEADLQADIPDTRLAELTAESGTVIDSAIVTKAIDSASDAMDRYLAGRYTVPVTDATALEILRPTCVAIVRFRLYGRRDQSMDPKDDPVRVEYDEAMRWLRDVAKGAADLPPSATAATVTIPDADSDDASFGSEDPVFTDAGLL